MHSWRGSLGLGGEAVRPGLVRLGEGTALGALSSIPDTGGDGQSWAPESSACVMGAPEAAAEAKAQKAQAGYKVKPFSHEDNPVVGLGPRGVLLSPAFQGFRLEMGEALSSLFSPSV